MAKFTHILHRLLSGVSTARKLRVARDSGTGYEPMPETPSQRANRLARWCQDGQRSAAELELHEWQRSDDCPAEARLLLASLLETRGERESARRVLRRAFHDASHTSAPILQFKAAMHISADAIDIASRRVAKLHDWFGQSPAVRAWLHLMDVPGVEELPAISGATVQRLAAELVNDPAVIPSLVAAQTIQTDASTLDALRQAMPRVARELSDPSDAVMVCRAAAELALLAMDKDDARRWAQRGLRINPMSAPLALALAAAGDDPAVGPPAVEVLRRAHEANPNYPDVRAALIRSEFASGQREAARQRLAQWEQQQPGQPLAAALRREMAA
jgi:lipopolysaccharide biosynthesis regulator YciM